MGRTVPTGKDGIEIPLCSNGMSEQRGDAAVRNPCSSDSCRVGIMLVRQGL